MFPMHRAPDSTPGQGTRSYILQLRPGKAKKLAWPNKLKKKKKNFIKPTSNIQVAERETNSKSLLENEEKG